MNYVGITEINTLRNNVLSNISNEIDKTIYDAFFKNTKIDSVKDNVINVICESKLTKSVLEQKYLSLVESAVEKCTSSNYSVRFYLNSNEVETPAKNDLSTYHEYFSNNFIDPNYTFDSFVVGPSNTEAHKASLIVATSPGTLYETLFIYGGSGLGKTHLLNAIANYIKDISPEKKILICSSQDFVNEYLDFVNSDSKREQLINFIRRFDVFLIDDIQMLKDKKKTQEFFFNIYEHFRQNHKQVVLTSDKLPGELDGIDSRLITRFTSGLSVPIYKPDTETCIEILKKKITRGGYNIENYDEDVIFFLADKFKDSIRSLEGALMRLNFYASINRADHIDINIALDALKGMVDCSDAKSKITEQKVLNTIANYYNLSVTQITGKIKTANIVTARHIAIYLIRTLLNTPYKKIGELFSKRDHSTIMHSVEKVEEMLKTDTQLKTVVDELKKRLQS